MDRHILTVRRDDDDSATGHVFIRLSFTEVETIRVQQGESERDLRHARNIDLDEGAEYAYRLHCMCEEGTYTRWAENAENLRSLI